MGRNDYVLRCHSNKNHWLNIHLQPFVAYYHSNSIASQIRIYPKPTFSVFQVTVKLSCLTGDFWIALSTLPSSTSNLLLSSHMKKKKKRNTEPLKDRSSWHLSISYNHAYDYDIMMLSNDIISILLLQNI